MKRAAGMIDDSGNNHSGMISDEILENTLRDTSGEPAALHTVEQPFHSAQVSPSHHRTPPRFHITTTCLHMFKRSIDQSGPAPKRKFSSPLIHRHDAEQTPSGRAAR